MGVPWLHLYERQYVWISLRYQFLLVSIDIQTKDQIPLSDWNSRKYIKFDPQNVISKSTFDPLSNCKEISFGLLQEMLYLASLRSKTGTSHKN